MKTKFLNNILILPSWSFAAGDPKVPHRSHTLACCRLGDKTHAYVHANHKHSLFWVHVVGPGFAGDRSRRTNTVTTRSKPLADLWIAAVNEGRIRIEDL